MADKTGIRLFMIVIVTVVAVVDVDMKKDSMMRMTARQRPTLVIRETIAALKFNFMLHCD